jgi:coproporphyrinogen III oxidase
MSLDEKKATAAAWFRTLRDDICAKFETIEAEYAAAHPVADSSMRSADGPREPEAVRPNEGGPVGGGDFAPRGEATARFIRTPWQRDGGGSGEMSIMKGRVFEKVGVNISVVQGTFSEQFRHEIPGASEDPNFWAAGISLVAHMASPLVPAAHMNTRMIAVGERPTRLWFGGGGDLNPMVENSQDTADFHAAFKAACDGLNTAAHASSEPSSNYYDAFKQWCDEYFFIPHRNEARGVGGIFYDYLGLNRFGADTAPVTSGRFGKGGVTAAATAHGMQLAANAAIDWGQGLAFTQQVGRAFASIYPALIRRHMFEPWTEAERHHQLVKRGRYAEYNLLYDRGTRFGLMTGGNTEAILMSLPPVAIWE